MMEVQTLSQAFVLWEQIAGIVVHIVLIVMSVTGWILITMV